MHQKLHESRHDPAENGTGLNVPEGILLDSISEEGKTPVIIRVPSPQEEIARAANEAHALREGGLQPGKLLMLHANSSLESALRAALERKPAPGRGWWCCEA